MAVALAPGLSRKLKKVLECRTDSPDVLASLNTLSTFYTDNNQQSRRNLRSTVEKRSLSINQEFLLASDSAQQPLDRVEEEVNALADCCDKIAKALSSCSATTGDIISTTERLKQELEITTQRQEIVTCFLRDYQLSADEINALREKDMSENFFKGLSHVQEIHSNCKVLLRTHHQIHTKIRNRLEQKRLNGLVYVCYNQILHHRYQKRDIIDPISLKDIDESNEWLTGMMNSLDLDEGGGDTSAPDLVFADEDLDWAVVSEAMGVHKP